MMLCTHPLRKRVGKMAVSVAAIAAVRITGMSSHMGHFPGYPVNAVMNNGFLGIVGEIR